MKLSRNDPGRWRKVAAPASAASSRNSFELPFSRDHIRPHSPFERNANGSFPAERIQLNASLRSNRFGDVVFGLDNDVWAVRVTDDLREVS